MGRARRSDLMGRAHTRQSSVLKTMSFPRHLQPIVIDLVICQIIETMEMVVKSGTGVCVVLLEVRSVTLEKQVARGCDHPKLLASTGERSYC